MGYDVDNSGAICINQIQGSRDKTVAFRFHSSFQINTFLLKLLEESFLKKGVPVYMEKIPHGIENASYASKAMSRYEIFRSGLIGLNRKYSLDREKA
ncbi:hypothetical protein AUK10_02635 [Candidatus Gracilibacteria bacterium CG2_30_37_12]|nr:MAG: hypothetical protein AUK10_02635 [Candidatus Gracilibacteria bacterium CG2_30_37_12]